MEPSSEQFVGIQTPEDVIARFGTPVRAIELPNTLWLFYRDFHYQFKKIPASTPTRGLGVDKPLWG
jgi:hypothetical protein